MINSIITDPIRPGTSDTECVEGQRISESTGYSSERLSESRLQRQQKHITHLPSAIRCQAQVLLCARWCPILRHRRPRVPLHLPVSRPRSLRGLRFSTALASRRVLAPIHDGLSLRLHIFVEVVCFVHLVHLRLLGIQPTLQEFGIILGECLITLFYLTKFELKCVDLVVQNL